MTGYDLDWEQVADAVITHDAARERAALRQVTCTGYRSLCGETVVPGEHQCADHFIDSAHRRADQDRAEINARHSRILPPGIGAA
jgi:hypothetical protein